MQRRDFLGALIDAAAWPLVTRAQQPVMPIVGLTAEDAQSIAQEAYVYFYPLVIMDVTRKYFSNIEAGKKFGRGPMNKFSHARTFPPATFRGATHPNFDTLYSLSWLDLTREPVVISVPDTQGRYYLLQMLDMWTDTFAGVGKRSAAKKCVAMIAYMRDTAAAYREEAKNLQAHRG